MANTSTLLADIENCYNRAMQAAKLSEKEEYTSADLHVSKYSEEEFIHWARTVDIYDLNKHAADFCLDEGIVAEFADYRRKVTAQLSKDFIYNGIKVSGQLENIGSCRDGSKLGTVNELDSLYVLDAGSIIVENSDRDGTFRIIRKDNSQSCEVVPRNLRKQFASACAHIISNLPLPNCLKHGGCKSPVYSGLRYNGPATTSQFLTEDKSLLTWDLTPTICLPEEHPTYREVRKCIVPVVERNSDKMSFDIIIHLIPDATENCWRLSTAQLEAEILECVVPRVKGTVSICKALANKLMIWNSSHMNYIPPQNTEYCDEIIKELDIYLEDKEKEIGCRLDQMLRYAHIWIPLEKRCIYHEAEKFHISINSAAIEHILLTAAFAEPETFSAKESKEHMHVSQLTMHVFNTLGDASQFSSPHAFLPGHRIPHFSILPSQAENKVALALSIKEQCRMISAVLQSDKVTKLEPHITKDMYPFPEGSSNISDWGTRIKDDDNKVAIQPSYKLDWTSNKKNWQKHVRLSEETVQDYIELGDIWMPRLPMQITPDKESLKYLFTSDTECVQTIHRIDPKTPGFAIGSRSWPSLLPELQTLTLATCPNHVCDILTVSTGEDQMFSKPSVCFWTIVSKSKEQVILEQLEYTNTVGRAIQYQIGNHSKKMQNMVIQCMLHSTYEEDDVLIENTLKELGMQSTQDFLSLEFNENPTFEGIQLGIAHLLLSRELSMKKYEGDQMSITLSAQQAKVLLDIKNNRVSYISSAPGTGKTICGITLYREFGRDRSVYICPTKPLLQYLRYNGCDGTLVSNDAELDSQMQHGRFNNKKCVIIDECHRLRCSKDHLGMLFKLLKPQRTCLYVFADNEFQSFDTGNQQRLENCIHDLSKEIFGYPPQYLNNLREVYRNTRKVVSFLQLAIEDTTSSTVSCANSSDGDGIQCIVFEHLWDNSHENSLVQYLSPLLIDPMPRASLDGAYHVTDIAVLLDAGYTTSDINGIGNILQTQFSRVTIQTSDKFPRTGITVDSIENFIGLDAPLCIFLLSVGRTVNPDKTIANPRYRVFLASRATQKAVFVVPSIDATVLQWMKLDQFQNRIQHSPPAEREQYLKRQSVHLVTTPHGDSFEDISGYNKTNSAGTGETLALHYDPINPEPQPH